MTQPYHLIPLRGNQAFRDAQSHGLDEAGLQRGDGHVAKGNDDGAHDNQHAEDAEQQRQPSEGGFHTEEAERRVGGPADSAGRQVRADGEADQRNDQDETEGLQHGADRDEQGGRDALAAGKANKVTKKVPQACRD